MTRQIVIRTKTRIEFKELGAKGRSLTAIGNRLYRTDERLMIPDLNTNREIVMYDLDGTQPYGTGQRLDPDETMALVDIARAGNGRGVNRLGWFSNITMKKAMPFIVILILVYAFATGGIRCWASWRTGWPTVLRTG